MRGGRRRERTYVFAFGSNEGDSHVHRHAVPPPSVPYEEQQGAWASWSRGVSKIPQREVMASLAERIRRGIKDEA